jgi:hypothetical protein
MLMFAGLASVYQPGTVDAPNPRADEGKFLRWSQLALRCAHDLAPFQSPQFRAVVVGPAPEAGERVVRYRLNIFDRELPRLELRREPEDPDSFVVEETGSEQ